MHACARCTHRTSIRVPRSKMAPCTYVSSFCWACMHADKNEIAPNCKFANFPAIRRIIAVGICSPKLSNAILFANFVYRFWYVAEETCAKLAPVAALVSNFSHFSPLWPSPDRCVRAQRVCETRLQKLRKYRVAFIYTRSTRDSLIKENTKYPIVLCNERKIKTLNQEKEMFSVK